MISTITAHFFAILFVACYVGSIYISKHARLSFSKTKVHLDHGLERTRLRSERWRDDPNVIRMRLLSVTCATLLCCAFLSLLMSCLAKDFQTALHMIVNHLGLTATSIFPHIITPLLFLGPLCGHFLRGTLPGQRHWSFRENVLSFIFSDEGIRNFLVAPITEEVVFRACVLAVYHLGQASRTRMIFLSPLLFGAAHVHHAWEAYNRYGRTATALKRAVFGAAFQFTYTWIFGFYCSYLFLCTGSIFPPITAHIFCNIMGVPQPSFDISQRPDRKLVIIAAYLVGILGFVSLLGPWTYTEGTLFWN